MRIPLKSAQISTTSPGGCSSKAKVAFDIEHLKSEMDRQQMAI